jgi:uncharacterized SAM-dependent methyltransferase
VLATVFARGDATRSAHIRLHAILAGIIVAHIAAVVVGAVDAGSGAANSTRKFFFAIRTEAVLTHFASFDVLAIVTVGRVTQVAFEQLAVLTEMSEARAILMQIFV